MRYLVDANLPRALTGWLAVDGDEAFYVDDLLDPPAADDDIWTLAADRDLIVVSRTLTSRCARSPGPCCLGMMRELEAQGV